MPTYLYKCEEHGEMELEHSIKIKLDKCPKCKKENLSKNKFKRLIAAPGNFVLKGSCWAKDNYS